MRSIDPAELSAFIDGELDAEQTAEVRAALAIDEALRAHYESLVQADAHLKGVAAGVTLSPSIRLSPAAHSAPERMPRGLWRALPVMVIPVVWLIVKLTEVDWLAVAASALAFLTLVVGVILIILNDEDGADARLSS
jgi:anti-sigma factor RsiW